MEIAELEVFYKDYHKLLLKRALLIVGDLAVAEDIIHDVFLKLMVKPSFIKNLENEKAYLLRAVSNSAINYWKSNQKLHSFDEDSDSSGLMFIATDSEEEDLEVIKQKIQYYLSKLSPRQQLIFKLSRYEGLDHQEIADYLEISKNTVKNQLVTALNFMRKNLPHSWLLLLDIFDIQ